MIENNLIYQNKQANFKWGSTSNITWFSGKLVINIMQLNKENHCLTKTLPSVSKIRSKENDNENMFATKF